MWKGKFDGNEESLPHGEHKPNAVKFKEIDDIKKLGLVLNLLSVPLMIVTYAIVLLRGGFDVILEHFWIYWAGILAAIACLIPHEFIHAVCFRKEAYIYTNLKNGMLFVSWKTIMFYIMLILGSTVLVQWHNRRSFHRILGAWYTYLIAYGVLAVGFKFVLYLLSSCFHVSTGMLSIPLWLLALLAISCILSWIAYHFLLEKQFRLYRGMQEEA